MGVCVLRTTVHQRQLLNSRLNIKHWVGRIVLGQGPETKWHQSHSPGLDLLLCFQAFQGCLDGGAAACHGWGWSMQRRDSCLRLLPRWGCSLWTPALLWHLGTGADSARGLTGGSGPWAGWAALGKPSLGASVGTCGYHREAARKRKKAK